MAQNMNTGVNYASGLPALETGDLQILYNNRISSYVIEVLRRRLPIASILQIESDVDLCGSDNYLIDEQGDDVQLTGTAIDAFVNRQTLTPPKIKSFKGYNKEMYEIKVPKEQLMCIEQSPVMKAWFQRALQRMTDKAYDSVTQRFYRHMMVNAHPNNSGLNAGLLTRNNVVGDWSNPVLLQADDGGKSVDRWHLALNDVLKQMPEDPPLAENEITRTIGSSYAFGPAELESVYLQSDKYTNYSNVGDCAACALFKDTFSLAPRGMLPITSYCVESREITTAAGQKCTLYPVLFGKSMLGHVGKIRLETNSYPTEDGQSIIFQVVVYSHQHTYDSRFTGLSVITIENPQPVTKNCT